MSRWPSKRADERAVGDVPDRRDAAQARDARGRDQARAVGREMQGGDLARELAERALRRSGRGGAWPPVQADLGVAGDGEPAAVARRVHRDDGPHLRVRGDLGHDQRQAVGLLALAVRVRPLRSRPRSARSRRRRAAARPWAASSVSPRRSGRGSMRLPLASPGQERGAVRGPSLQRGVAFERELPLAILVVVAARAVLLEDRSDAASRNPGPVRPRPRQPGPQ